MIHIIGSFSIRSRFILSSHAIIFDNFVLHFFKNKFILYHTIKWIILSFYIVIVFLNEELILIVIVLNEEDKENEKCKKKKKEQCFRSSLKNRKIEGEYFTLYSI